MIAGALVPGTTLEIPRAISGVNERSKTIRAVIWNARSDKSAKITVAPRVPIIVHIVI
jgi:hypothetical protein